MTSSPMRAGLILVVAGSLVSCVTRTEAPATTVLESLRQELDQIRSVTPTEPVAISTTPNVDGLAGMSHRAILVGLGEPDLCRRPDDGDCAGTGEWVYFFYRLPSGARGDGPELHVIFDADQRCLVAVWVMTR